MRPALQPLPPSPSKQVQADQVHDASGKGTATCFIALWVWLLGCTYRAAAAQLWLLKYWKRWQHWSRTQCLTSNITYKSSMLLDNNSIQSVLDLFISYESLVGLCMYEGSKLNIIANESILDWSTHILHWNIRTKRLNTRISCKMGFSLGKGENKTLTESQRRKMDLIASVRESFVFIIHSCIL